MQKGAHPHHIAASFVNFSLWPPIWVCTFVFFWLLYQTFGSVTTEEGCHMAVECMAVTVWIYLHVCPSHTGFPTRNSLVLKNFCMIEPSAKIYFSQLFTVRIFLKWIFMALHTLVWNIYKINFSQFSLYIMRNDMKGQWKWLCQLCQSLYLGYKYFSQSSLCHFCIYFRKNWLVDFIKEWRSEHSRKHDYYIHSFDPLQLGFGSRSWITMYGHTHSAGSITFF